ncbi:nuclease-related domain-containing protein [Salinisphaera sp. T5B8]|uniref:nuclease-related domain-containing protein n=1 Tax=Salinisphaera sp. T5B8 TaxID=1304154 RepID=UPI00333E6425
MKHPFTRGLRRPPGYSLSVQIPELQMEAVSRMFFAVVIGTTITVVAPIALGIFGVPGWVGILVGIAGAFGWGCVEAGRFIRLLALIRRKRLGWEGELATGEQLNQLYAHGYDIFHDLDGGRFNIDHVAVGPAGVFAIETKARVKSQGVEKEEYWRADFDGRQIDFAGYRTAAPLKQAQRNAEWLSRQLTSAIGEAVAVQPVVALPGWYVNRSGKSDIRVVNPIEFGKMIRGSRARPLDSSMIQRIAHQLDALCRDVAKDKQVVR